MTDALDLSDVRALVTGGTQGIGAAVAHRLETAGAAVVVAARTEARTVPAGHFIRADVAAADGVHVLAEQTLDLLGGIDVIVSNAGSQTHAPGGTSDLTDEDWMRDLNTNLITSCRPYASTEPSCRR